MMCWYSTGATPLGGCSPAYMSGPCSFVCAWTAVAGPGAKQLLQSSQKELIVSHRLNADDRRELQALGLSTKLCTIRVRLIKVCLPNGKLKILATSLQSTQRYPTQSSGQLYGMRWRRHRLSFESCTTVSSAPRPSQSAWVHTARVICRPRRR